MKWLLPFLFTSCLGWYPYLEVTGGEIEQFSSNLFHDPVTEHDGNVLLVTAGMQYLPDFMEDKMLRVIVVNPEPIVQKPDPVPIPEPEAEIDWFARITGLEWWQGLIGLAVIIVLAYLVKIGKIKVPFFGKNGLRGAG